MNSQPGSILATSLLILLDALFWLGFAVAVVLGVIPSIPAGAVRWTMSALALGCSTILAGTAIFLWKRKRFAFYFSVALLGVIAVLSIADEVGLLDLLALLVNLTALGLLLKDRAWYLRAEGAGRQQTDCDPASPWYHGSPLELTTIRSGSTITQKEQLARIFSHKPTIVSVEDDGRIKHNGTMRGYMYVIAEEVGPGDVVPHPQTTMAPGEEWLTRRELQLRSLGPVEVAPEEQLSDADLTALSRRMEEQRDQQSK